MVENSPRLSCLASNRVGVPEHILKMSYQHHSIFLPLGLSLLVAFELGSNAKKVYLHTILLFLMTQYILTRLLTLWRVSSTS